MNTKILAGDIFYHKDNFKITNYQVIAMLEKSDDMYFYLLNNNDLNDVKIAISTCWGGDASPLKSYISSWSKTKEGAYAKKLDEVQKEVETFKSTNKLNIFDGVELNKSWCIYSEKLEDLISSNFGKHSMNKCFGEPRYIVISEDVYYLTTKLNDAEAFKRIDHDGKWVIRVAEEKDNSLELIQR